MVAEPWGSDSGESDFWVNHLDQGQASADSAQPSALDQTWIRLVQRILNLRHLQRVFANVGQHLRNYPSLGSHLASKKVIEDHLAIWPWKNHLAVETPFGRGNPFGRENEQVAA